MSKEVVALVEALKAMQDHTTYKAGVEWGKPRGGHQCTGHLALFVAGNAQAAPDLFA